MKSQITNALSDFFFEYETPRQVLVRNRRVGVVCRLIQLGVLAYIIGWVFIYEKGYQSTDTAVSSVFTKMKGVGYTNVNGSERVWDVADYVFPPQGDSSFVVMTNYIITEGQSMGKCPELKGKHNCTSHTDCEGGRFKRTGHGEMTGVCVNTTNTCEVLAWCPVEDDHNIPDPPLLMSAENYTLFIKNSVTFPLFEGGAIGIVVDWTCNFDVDVTHCKPVYNFHGLYGNPDETDKARASVGYNFRWARKFDIIPTLTAIGSGVGIFGVATVVCDLVLLYLLPKREFYKNMKFKYTDTQSQHDNESLALDTKAYYNLEANARQVQGSDLANDPDSEAGSIETELSKK
ncbi:hypothetical protein INR49_015029 [Caranx melampygus]|nr:hypothetical protein INR49_015029 [Caranx melampygus]